MDLIRNGSNQRAIEPYERKKAEDIVKAAEQEPEIIDILECFVTFDMQNGALTTLYGFTLIYTYIFTSV